MFILNNVDQIGVPECVFPPGRAAVVPALKVNVPQLHVIGKDGKIVGIYGQIQECIISAIEDNIRRALEEPMKRNRDD